MLFHVTNNLIKEGIRLNNQSCPVALAIRAKGFDYVRVYMVCIMVNDDNFHMPPKVERFVRKFDNKKEVKPFSFSLPVKITRKVKKS